MSVLNIIALSNTIADFSINTIPSKYKPNMEDIDTIVQLKYQYLNRVSININSYIGIDI